MLTLRNIWTFEEHGLYLWASTVIACWRALNKEHDSHGKQFLLVFARWYGSCYGRYWQYQSLNPFWLLSQETYLIFECSVQKYIWSASGPSREVLFNNSDPVTLAINITWLLRKVSRRCLPCNTCTLEALESSMFYGLILSVWLVVVVYNNLSSKECRNFKFI